MESWIKNKKILVIISIITILISGLVISIFIGSKTGISRTKLRNEKFIQYYSSTIIRKYLNNINRTSG